jgi:hypothetical protein
MERTITHLKPRLDTQLGVVIGWQARITVRLDGHEAMNMIEASVDETARRPLDHWTQTAAASAVVSALDAPTGHAAAQMRALIDLLQSRVRFPLLDNFKFPED